MKYFIVFVLGIFILLLIYVNMNIREGAPQLGSGSNQAAINSIEDMRTFLEQMYMVCLLNPNDQSENKIFNTDCYKISILATYLWPLLGPYTYWSLDDLSPRFGAPTKPTSVAKGMAAEQNPNPPPVPIILNDRDYQLFLQLAIIGNIIQPFATVPHNNWRSAVVWFKDGKSRTRDCCRERWGGYQASYALIQVYIKEIKTILGYFHSQTTSSNTTFYGDSIYTELY